MNSKINKICLPYECSYYIPPPTPWEPAGIPSRDQTMATGAIAPATPSPTDLLS